MSLTEIHISPDGYSFETVTRSSRANSGRVNSADDPLQLNNCNDPQITVTILIKYDIVEVGGSQLALDRSFVGKSFLPFTFEVDKSKIRELALALGDENPIYRDDEAARAAGLPGIVAPPTFPTLFKMWGEGGSSVHIKAMGGDVLRLLHGGEAFEYHRLIRPGDVITGQTRITSIDEKEGRSGHLDIATLETTYHNQHGELVVTAQTTIVIRG